MEISKQALIPFIDLTQLSSTTTVDNLRSLAQQAQTPEGNVAAVCIDPCFVKEMVSLLQGSAVKVATVANFPHGELAVDAVVADIQQAIKDGAQEIDVVFPYRAYLAGQQQSAIDFVRACRRHCPKQVLKVILETGVLQDRVVIAEATKIVIKAGANFVKTSTGKRLPGATLEAAIAILATIKALSSTINHPVGLKVAGGIREPDQALQYLHLAQEMMGPGFLTPVTLRIGSSQLIERLR